MERSWNNVRIRSRSLPFTVDLVSDSVSCTKGKDDHSMRPRLLVARKASAVAVHLQPGRLGSARGSPGTLGAGA